MPLILSSLLLLLLALLALSCSIVNVTGEGHEVQIDRAQGSVVTKPKKGKSAGVSGG